MLNVVDEFTHECLAIRINRKLKPIDVIDVLSDLFILRGVPGRIPSDNGPEFIAKALQDWIAAHGCARPPASHLGARGRTVLSKVLMHACVDELLNGEILLHVAGSSIVVESWRRHYNAVRPHASLGYRPPAPEVFVPALSAWPATRRPAPPATLALPPALN